MKKDILIIGLWLGVVIIGIYGVYTLLYSAIFEWYAFNFILR